PTGAGSASLDLRHIGRGGSAGDGIDSDLTDATPHEDSAHHPGMLRHRRMPKAFLQSGQDLLGLSSRPQSP
ncbi:MAG: hypothetical protein ABI414_16695, partial [Devosia sp.]